MKRFQTDSLLNRTFKLPPMLASYPASFTNEMFNKMTDDTKGTRSNPCACD